MGKPKELSATEIAVDAIGPLRVFFAVWPDPAAGEAIAALARDVAKTARGHAPRPENHHLTLAFVGAVAPARVAALERIGAEAALAAAPFELALDSLGSFHHAGIAWLGAAVVPDALRRLSNVLRDGLTEEGFRVERRPFRVHVTLARRCGTVTAATISPITFRVERMTLNRSQLQREGSIYRELAAWPLGNTK